MFLAQWMREDWTDTPVPLEKNSGDAGSPKLFGGGQWLVVAVPPSQDLAAEAVRDARAMGVRVTGLVLRAEARSGSRRAKPTSLDAFVPLVLDEPAANRWAMEAADVLKSEPPVRQVLLVGNSETMAAALEREFPLATHFRIPSKQAPDASEILAVLLHTPRCC